MTDTYNGWSNRSTWLVDLHMLNTTKEITDLYQSAARISTDLATFKNRVIRLMPHCPLLDKEEQFYLNEIDYQELQEANKEA